MLDTWPIQTAGYYFSKFDHDLMARVANELGKEIDGKERPGGVMAIEILYHNMPEYSNYATAIIGAPGLKLPEKAFFAHEKIRRLAALRSTGAKHYASSESADFAQEKYGGAVVGHMDDCCHTHPYTGIEMYVAYSGAPPEIDEALCHVFAQYLCLWDIPDDYQNPWVEKVRNLYDEAGHAIGREYVKF